MRAIRLHEHGPTDNLVLDELPDLTPASGQARIAVEAAGVHLLDAALRRGEPGPMSMLCGRWRPLVTTYPLAAAATAHRDLEERHALGKVVLVSERAHDESSGDAGSVTGD